MRTRLVKAPGSVAVMVGGALLIWGATIPVAAADNPYETAACLDCHDDAAFALATGPHAVRVGDQDTRVGCTACHTGSAAHYEDDPAANPMGLPGGGDVLATAGLCAACHENAHQANQSTLNPHAGAGVTCLDCHKVHGGTTVGQLQRSEPALCYECHAAQEGEFAKPSHHPAGFGEAISCSDCHLATGDRMAPLARQGTTAMCVSCHTEFQGPFPYEHQATVDYSTEEGGCANCHEPHGSYLPRLLKQPYEPPHHQLCSQCHTVPLHNYNSHHGDAWAGVSCAECHTDIHGSYTNRLFATPALEAQGCFAAGCHSR